jgi:hypothetical protein
MTRQEHLDWCKQIALEYAEKGDTDNAIKSLMSDLAKHEETKNHVGMELGISLIMIGSLNSRTEVIDFIKGFH